MSERKRSICVIGGGAAGMMAAGAAADLPQNVLHCHTALTAIAIRQPVILVALRPVVIVEVDGRLCQLIQLAVPRAAAVGVVLVLQMRDDILDLGNDVPGAAVARQRILPAVCPGRCVCNHLANGGGVIASVVHIRKFA